MPGPKSRCSPALLLLAGVLLCAVLAPAMHASRLAAQEAGSTRIVVPGTAADTPPLPGPDPAPTLGQCRTATGTLPFVVHPVPAWIPVVERARQRYHDLGVNYRAQLADYTTDGDYLNWGTLDDYEETRGLRFDSHGIPTIEINGDGNYYYHPTTIAQYGLVLYGRWLRGEAGVDQFLTVAGYLLTAQDSDGGFRMPFPYYYYLSGEILQSGWVSSLTQAQALSVFARAYLVTGDERYLDAGNRALAFMTTPAAQGGTLGSLAGLRPLLADYAFFRTFPAMRTAYTLNGHMFTMLGLYDWWQVDPQQRTGPSADAHAWFDCSLATLRLILPLYDLGGFSAYDLGYLVYGVLPNAHPNYHATDIALFHALASITGDPLIGEYESRWRGHVDDLHGTGGR